jgi:hypothetical protein
VQALSTDQVVALTTAQVQAGLSTTQIQALGTSQVAAMQGTVKEPTRMIG